MIDHTPQKLKVRAWIELIAFLSAYYPLFLILLIQDIGPSKKTYAFGPTNWNLYISEWALYFFLTSSGATLLIGSYMRKNLKYQEGGISIEVRKATKITGDMVNYTIPFLMGLFSFNYSSLQAIASLIVFLAFMYSFLHKEQIALLNPMLLLMNIALYKINYKETGRDPEFEKIALCLGEVKASTTKIYIKETAGITFIYPTQTTGK